MSTPDTDGWIAFSEREPTTEQMCRGVWLADVGGVWIGGVCRNPANIQRQREWQHYTHWREVEPDPAPPKREPTQLERDNEAMCAWYDRKHYEGSIFQTETWHAAIAYERAEVRALIYGGSVAHMRHAIGSRFDELARRVGLKLD